VTAAQIAVAVLTGWVIAVGAVLLLDEEYVAGAIVAGFGLIGFLSLLGMVVSDRAPRR
jgi:hypothetical protein